MADRELTRGSDPNGGALPGDPPRELRWSGRTGAGQRVALYSVGDWIEVVYYEHDGTTVRGGFALNPLYAGQLAVELVRVIAARDVTTGRRW